MLLGTRWVFEDTHLLLQGTALDGSRLKALHGLVIDSDCFRQKAQSSALLVWACEILRLASGTKSLEVLLGRESALLTKGPHSLQRRVFLLWRAHFLRASEVARCQLDG